MPAGPKWMASRDGVIVADKMSPRLTISGYVRRNPALSLRRTAPPRTKATTSEGRPGPAAAKGSPGDRRTAHFTPSVGSRALDLARFVAHPAAVRSRVGVPRYWVRTNDGQGRVRCQGTPTESPQERRARSRIDASPATTRWTSLSVIPGQIGSEITRSNSRVATGWSSGAVPQRRR